MTEATFTVPAVEFSQAFFEQIQSFLNGSTDSEVVVQIRRKRKPARKKTGPSAANGLPKTEAAAAVFVKKYPQQPTPEEAEKLLASMLANQKIRASRSLEEGLRDRKPIGEAEWFRLAAELNIEESAEELIAMLTK